MFNANACIYLMHQRHTGWYRLSHENVLFRMLTMRTEPAKLQIWKRLDAHNNHSLQKRCCQVLIILTTSIELLPFITYKGRVLSIRIDRTESAQQ